MKRFAVTITIVVLAISYLPYITQAMPSTSSDVGRKLQLNYLGSADGKSFFAESGTPLTWLEANQFCKNSSMQLATITSVAQQNVLKNAPNTTFTNGHWTGGRDSRTHSQFAWESGDAPLNSTLAGPIDSYLSIQTCVYYQANVGIRKLRSSLCITKWYTLCQIST